MQYPVLTRNARNLARGAALVLVAGVAAGCSSDVLRFQDAISTGSTQNQRDIIAPRTVQQPFPGDAGNLDTMSTGSVQPRGARRSDLLAGPVTQPRPDAAIGQGGYQTAPHQQAALAAPRSQPFPSQPSSQVARQPMPAVQRQPAPLLDQTPTGSTMRQPPAAAPAVAAGQPSQPVQDMYDGWSRAGGTQIAVRQGETVYNLSRRYGVPVSAILKANGLTDANSLAAGQKVVIPTYVYSRTAPNSMPDSNPNVADARSSTGTRYDVDPSQVPLPRNAPAERVAVLPASPRVNAQEAQPANDAAPRGPTDSGNSYTVVSGDTLSSIARRTGTTTAAIKQANGLDGGVLRIGQKLVIPGSRTVAAAPRQAQPALDPATTATPRAEPRAASARPSEGVIREASLDRSPAPDATGIGRMRWPARGRIVSGFGSSGGKRNDGIDISVPEGTPVKAAENGVVIYAGDGLKEFGNTVLVRHEDGLVTVYGHASALKVKRGDTVRRGQEIATSGLSGNADQPKLHFEVRKDSTPVDPVKFLE